MPAEDLEQKEFPKVSIVPYEDKYQVQVEGLILGIGKELGFEPNPTYNADLKNPQAEYVDTGGMFLVALEGEKVIGTVAVRRKSDTEGELKRTYVDPQSQSKGLGKQLVDQAISFCKEQGFEKLTLDTDFPRMQSAIHFYWQLGFKEDKRVKKEEDRYNVFMSLDLKRSRLEGREDISVQS